MRRSCTAEARPGQRVAAVRPSGPGAYRRGARQYLRVRPARGTRPRRGECGRATRRAELVVVLGRSYGERLRADMAAGRFDVNIEVTGHVAEPDGVDRLRLLRALFELPVRRSRPRAAADIIPDQAEHLRHGGAAALDAHARGQFGCSAGSGIGSFCHALGVAGRRRGCGTPCPALEGSSLRRELPPRGGGRTAGLLRPLRGTARPLAPRSTRMVSSSL